jgi:hypothetical protein
MGLSFYQQLTITLIDKAVIGGLLAVAAYLFNRSLANFKGTQSLELARFTQEQNRSLEEFKTRLTTEGESLRSIRLAVAELAKRLAAANHCICWVCWTAQHAPENFNAAGLDKYEGEIHLLLSEIVGARVVLSALSKSVHDQISPLINKLYQLDAEMGNAKRICLKTPEEGIHKLAILYNTSREFDDQLLEAVSSLAW